MPPPVLMAHVAATAQPVEEAEEEEVTLPSVNSTDVHFEETTTTTSTAALRPGRLGMNDELTLLLSRITGEERTTMPPPSVRARVPATVPPVDEDSEDDSVILPISNASLSIAEVNSSTVAPTELHVDGRLEGMNSKLAGLLTKITGEARPQAPTATSSRKKARHLPLFLEGGY